MTLPLEALRWVETADVYKAGQLAAELRREATGTRFTYRPEYLESGKPPVAFTLPLSDEAVQTHMAGAIPPFFAGLLPEGRRLYALRRAVKTSADDELSLLLAVGGDAIGDVRVVAQGESPNPSSPRLNVDSWEAVSFSELLGEVGSTTVDRVALPGVQEKASAAVITLPVTRRGERFILKLNPPEFPHLVTNEKFFMDAARSSGLDVAAAEVVHDRDGNPGLLVRRFDRRSDPSGGTVMLAQEDACQVLGLYPADKYRVTSEEVVLALARVCRARPVAVRDLFRQMVFAYLTCNGDAHAKNFSVLHDGEWRVAPAYDIPSSHPYGDHTLALSVAGRFREDVGRATFLELAATVGLAARAAESAIDQLVERTERWLPGLDTLPFGTRMVHKLRKAIEYRRSRLRETQTRA